MNDKRSPINVYDSCVALRVSKFMSCDSYGLWTLGSLTKLGLGCQVHAPLEICMKKASSKLT